MIISKYTCNKCGSHDFFFEKENEYHHMHIGIYCANCGHWIKWADKDDKNLMKRGDKD